jgi:predicted RNA-binding protein with RPS1 domain
LPFIEFIADHPVGSEVEATVERFSSHGAYVLSGDARGYVPLRNLARPAPRSARDVLNLGEKRRFVVIAIDAPRRGIDMALPGVAEVPAGSVAPVEEQVVAALGMTEAPAPAEASAARKAKAAASRASTKRTATKKAAAKKTPAAKRTTKEAPAKATVTKRATAKKAASSPGATVKAAARKAAARKTSTKKAAAKAGTRKSPRH